MKINWLMLYGETVVLRENCTRKPCGKNAEILNGERVRCEGLKNRAQMGVTEQRHCAVSLAQCKLYSPSVMQPMVLTELAAA